MLVSNSPTAFISDIVKFSHKFSKYNEKHVDRKIHGNVTRSIRADYRYSSKISALYNNRKKISVYDRI